MLPLPRCWRGPQLYTCCFPPTSMREQNIGDDVLFLWQSVPRCEVIPTLTRCLEFAWNVICLQLFFSHWEANSSLENNFSNRF